MSENEVNKCIKINDWDIFALDDHSFLFGLIDYDKDEQITDKVYRKFIRAYAMNLWGPKNHLNLYNKNRGYIGCIKVEGIANLKKCKKLIKNHEYFNKKILGE